MRRWRGIGWVGPAVLWAFVGAGGGPAEGAKWSRAEIDALPDEAFASVEERPDGTRARHLPHHDAHGRVDLPHLRNAMSRFDQVRWADPANAEAARRHLLEHFKELRLPVPGEGRARQRFVPQPRIYRQEAPPVAGAVHPKARSRSVAPGGPRVVRSAGPSR